jgi:hypothetical protein
VSVVRRAERRLPLRLTRGQALSRLATVPPKLFARERGALVDQIRRAGDEKTAKIVKARRAPTIPVWVVNRLALAHPKTVDELIDAADRVKAIQLGRRQEAGRLAKAMAVYRAVLDRLLDHSRSLLKEAGTGTSHQMLLRIERTMNAALVDPSVRATLRRGELERELNAPGFDVFDGVRPVESGSCGRRAARMPTPSTERQTTAAAIEKTPRRHRRRNTAGQNHERLWALQAAADSARETLAAIQEQARLTKARLTTLLHEVKEVRGKLKAHAREARRHARALRLALKALGGHQRQAASLRR